MNPRAAFCRALSLLFGALIAIGSSARAQSWDLAADWNPPANPNGVWSYGDYDSNVFSPLPYDASAIAAGSTGVYQMAGGQQSDGFIYLNNSGAAADGIAPGQVSLEADWGTPVARWTAPETGLYDFSVMMGGTTATEDGGVGNNFAQYAGLNINGTSQTSTSFVGQVIDWTLTDVPLSAGSNVDAYVQNPGYANAGNTATIFDVQAVPEPSSFGLLAIGAVAPLMLFRRKRIRPPPA